MDYLLLRSLAPALRGVRSALPSLLGIANLSEFVRNSLSSSLLYSGYKIQTASPTLRRRGCFGVFNKSDTKNLTAKFHKSNLKFVKKILIFEKAAKRFKRLVMAQ